jgi:hypothetical protein
MAKTRFNRWKTRNKNELRKEFGRETEKKA